MDPENNGFSTDQHPYNDPTNKGHFKPGNPGRPRGAKGRTKRAITTALQNRTDAALAALDALIEARSEKAILYVLQRNLPKDRAIELHGMDPEDIEAALMDGSISPDEGRTLVQTLTALKQLRDLNDLEARLKRLEQVLGDENA